MNIDEARVAKIIADVAREEIAARFGKLDRDAVRAKSGPGDLVTTADEAAERRLRQELHDLAPGASFIGEEAAAANPQIAAAIATEHACWIVDPLDGTRNFVNGVDEFGVIVAYVERGRTLAGWIYAIPHGLTLAASSGAGALINGGRIVCKPPTQTIPAGFRSSGWLSGEWRNRIVANLKKNVASQPAACSAYAYLRLLRGEADFALFSRVHPWDHAAGALMLAETGGEARWLDDGTPYQPAASSDRPYLASAPGRNWADIRRRLLD